MTPEQIPQELVDLLDERAGKKHSRDGAVLTTLAEILTRYEATGVLVCEGWWHPNVVSGRVHDHPANPGRSWSAASHRLCEPVYTKRGKPADRVAPTGSNDG